MHQWPAPAGDGGFFALRGWVVDRDVEAADAVAVAVAAALPKDVPIVRLRALESAEVQIAAVGLVPRIVAQEGRSRALEVDTTYACFTEIVQRGPDEITDDVGKPLDRFPVLQSL